MVKNDWEGVTFGAIGYSLLTLMWGGIAIESWSYQGAWGLGSMAVFAALAAIYSVQAWRWKPMNFRRQIAAVWGFASRVPLATAHPLPNVGALPLPFTIILRPNWPKFMIALATLIGTFVLSDATAYHNHRLHIINLSDPFELLFFLLPTIVVGVSSVLLLRSQRIEATPDGLRVRQPIGWIRFRTERIRWNDARLFAIRGGKPGGPGTRYELSSPTSVVEWTRIQRPRWWSLHRPAIPFAEYDAQTEALIALISGITGLPLYDVRQASQPDVSPRPEVPAQPGRSANHRTTLSAVLVALSFGCQMEGFPGVLLAKVHNDGRPVVLFLEIMACLLALTGLWFGYLAPGNQTRLVLIGNLCLVFAIIGMILFPFGPFVP